jgi:hypothetical protein
VSSSRSDIHSTIGRSIRNKREPCAVGGVLSPGSTPERTEDRRVLEADDALTDDEEGSRELAEMEEVVAGEDRLVIDDEPCRHAWCRSDSDDDEGRFHSSSR